MKYEITNPLAFVLTRAGRLGYAAEGTFAASSWMISDKAFNSVMGRKFSWIAPDGGTYTDDRDMFRRPTEYQVRALASERLLEKAAEAGHIRLLDEPK